MNIHRGMKLKRRDLLFMKNKKTVILEIDLKEEDNKWKVDIKFSLTGNINADYV